MPDLLLSLSMLVNIIIISLIFIEKKKSDKIMKDITDTIENCYKDMIINGKEGSRNVYD